MLLLFFITVIYQPTQLIVQLNSSLRHIIVTQILAQIRHWEDTLERMHCEQFRLRCYMASLQNGELPNPKVILWSLFLIQGNIVVSGNLINLLFLMFVHLHWTLKLFWLKWLLQVCVCVCVLDFFFLLLIFLIIRPQDLSVQHQYYD